MGIELFRGIAALMVLVTHYARFISDAPPGLAFLWTGVDMFFVISGYVFAPMLFERRVAVGPYLVRRFFRLYPLYFCALVAYWFFTPETADKLAYFLRHLVFLHTTSSIQEAYFFNPAFWSLPVEIEYYLLLPLMAAVLTTRRRLLGLFGASLALAYFLYYQSNSSPAEVDGWRIASVHISGLLCEFMVGSFLYYVVQQAPARGLSLGVALLGALLVASQYLVQYGGLGLAALPLATAPFNFLCALGYAMIMLPVLRVAEADWHPWLCRLAIFCGTISYGVYLFHNLSPRLLQSLGMAPSGWDIFALSTVLSLAIALLLFRIVEDPARQYGRLLSKRMLHGKSEKQASPDPDSPQHKLPV